MKRIVRAGGLLACALLATVLVLTPAAFAEEVIVEDTAAEAPVEEEAEQGTEAQEDTTQSEPVDYSIPVSAGYTIQDGKAQAVYPYTPGTNTRSYSNDSSNIIRFAVWVETSADTDVDGKLDLIKAIVQLPRAAMEGAYKASVIYEANPGSAGMTTGKGYLPEDLPGGSTVHLGELSKSGNSRKARSTVSTVQAAAAADPSDWYYQTAEDKSHLLVRRFLKAISPLLNPLFDGDAQGMFESTFGFKLDETWEYTNLTTYDNFLAQGYAVVLTAGLGTYGSEGIPCSGFPTEARAASMVVKWLNGRAKAFADPEGTQAIKADWCSGNVGMIGRGYAGALAFEVASMGIGGLKTVVPIDGIASWYDYANSQGEAYTNTYGGLNVLSATIASGISDGQRDNTVVNRFQYFLSRMNEDQSTLAGTFAPIRAEGEEYDQTAWEFADFAYRENSLKASALIVHGLNDQIVRTKQFELMRSVFAANQCEVKLLLHRNGCVSPADEERQTEIMIGSETYDDLLNRWFAHYLLEVDNGIENMDRVTVQSNVDGSFYTYSTFAVTNNLHIAPAAGTMQTISSAGAPRLLSEQYELLNGNSTNFASVWSADISSDVILQGTPEVVLRLSTNTTEPPDMAVSVVLSDEADAPFASYELDSSGALPYEVIEQDGVSRGEGAEPYDLVQYATTDVTKHLITMGSINLRCPDATFDPRTARFSQEGIVPGEYYEYHVYLNPTNYTVQAGHHLRVYILTYATADATQLFGAESESAGRFGDYELTIDASGSYADIPCL